MSAAPEILVVIDAEGRPVRLVTEIAAHVWILRGGELADGDHLHVCAGGAIERELHAAGVKR